MYEFKDGHINNTYKCPMLASRQDLFDETGIQLFLGDYVRGPSYTRLVEHRNTTLPFPFCCDALDVYHIARLSDKLTWAVGLLCRTFLAANVVLTSAAATMRGPESLSSQT
jgi:hypothetical protein